MNKDLTKSRDFQITEIQILIIVKLTSSPILSQSVKIPYKQNHDFIYILGVTFPGLILHVDSNLHIYCLEISKHHIGQMFLSTMSRCCIHNFQSRDLNVKMLYT